MKRALLVAALFITWLAARPEATAWQCVQKDPCKALPCEFMASLNLAKALLRNIAIQPAPATTSASARKAYLDRVSAAHEKSLKDYRKCFFGLPGFDVPIVALDSACTITPSLADALKSGDTCSEAIEAEFARAKVSQSICEATGGKSTTVAELKARNIVGAQARINYLQASLLQYLSSCAPDAELSKQLSSAGLDALMQQGQQARDAWKAKRASQVMTMDPLQIFGSAR